MSIVTFSRESTKDELAREMDRRGEVIERLESQIDAQRSEIARVRTALEPFAEETDGYLEETPDDFRLKAVNEDGEVDDSNLTVGDLRRARAALQGGKG